MYEREYRKHVLNDFENKLASGLLPPELIAPTRASLRDHCVKVFKERFEKKDEPLIESFYGKKHNQAAYKIAVQNCDAEEFRNLNNFLRDRTKGTAFKNISMLAWMIDFNPRPFHEDIKIAEMPVKDDGISTLTNEKDLNQQFDNHAIGKSYRSATKLVFDTVKKFMITIWLDVAFILFLIGYFLVISGSHKNSIEGGCMIWNGEMYEKVQCSYKPENRDLKVVALDTTLQKHFKKIMNDDTLSIIDTGKVWCIKINGRYEYYTDSASYPLNPTKRLRRLTPYILNNNAPM